MTNNNLTALAIVVAATLAFLLGLWGYRETQANHEDRRQHIEACQTIEDVEVRALCLAGI